MEGKSEETKNEMEKADKRRNPFRFEAEVLLTGLREWYKKDEGFGELFGAGGLASLPVVREV